ncbi:hypothetical protein CWO89_25205 [Bradyrhizobium sp. Leo170]|nr:hypothetical protein CWO89_25205 [Bradyrhizobium sp. Leo170]
MISAPRCVPYNFSPPSAIGFKLHPVLASAHCKSRSRANNKLVGGGDQVSAQVFGDILQRGVETLAKHRAIAVFLHARVFAEVVFVDRT